MRNIDIKYIFMSLIIDTIHIFLIKKLPTSTLS